MMKLVCFDLETTGLDKIKDSIIQFAGIVIDTDTDNIIDQFNTYIKPVGNYSISLGAYFKHRITPKQLENAPKFEEVAPRIIELFNKAENILTYNGNAFDIPFLKESLNKIGLDIDFTKKNCYDAFLEEQRRNGLRLSDTYHRYTGQTMEESGLDAHNAFSDIKATYSIFTEQSKKQEYGPEHTYGEDNFIGDKEFLGSIKPCFRYGKYKDISVEYVASVDQNYLKWCISDKGNFTKSTKEYIKQYVK